jgi:FMN phosphatase YigB (HAD superfamily)
VTTPAEIVFLLDVDNTLLDNDRFAADLTAQLDQVFGPEGRERYWSIYAELRDALGYADYLGALQRFRIGNDNESALLQTSTFLLDYPFNERLYPHALAAIEHLCAIGTPVILSDGDIVFQPRKIHHSGLWDAVDGRVLIYVHKERMLDAMQRRFPAKRYVMVDDKPQLLAAMKRVLGNRLTTVFVRQGHYAAESASIAIDPAPDKIIQHIGDLRKLAKSDFHAIASTRIVDADREQRSSTASPEQS